MLIQMNWLFINLRNKGSSWKPGSGGGGGGGGRTLYPFFGLSRSEWRLKN